MSNNKGWIPIDQPLDDSQEGWVSIDQPLEEQTPPPPRPEVTFLKEGEEFTGEAYVPGEPPQIEVDVSGENAWVPIDQPLEKSQPTAPAPLREVEDYSFILPTPTDAPPDPGDPDFIETIDPDGAIRESWVEMAEDIGKVYPMAETAVTTVTSVYGLPISGYAGLVTLPFAAVAKELGWTDKSPDEVASDAIEIAQTLLVYQPKTKSGERLTERIFYPMELLQEVAKHAGEKVLDETDSALLASVVEGAIVAAPMALPFARKAGKGVINSKGPIGSFLRRRLAGEEVPPSVKKVKIPTLDEVGSITKGAVELGNKVRPDQISELRRIYDQNAERYLKEMEDAVAANDFPARNEAHVNLQRNQFYKEAAEVAEKKAQDLGIPIAEEVSKISSNINETIRAKEEWLAKRSEEIPEVLAHEAYINEIKKVHEDIIKASSEALDMEKKAGILSPDSKLLYLKRIRLHRKGAAEATFKLSDLAEKRFQESRGQYKSTITKVREHVNESWTSFRNSLLREFQHLPRTKEFAPARHELLKLQKQRDIVSAKVLTHLDDMMKDLKPEAGTGKTKLSRKIRNRIAEANYELFSKKIILEDILEDVKLTGSKGAMYKDVPLETLRADKLRVDKAIAENPIVAEAINKRGALWENLRKDYIQAMKDIGHDVSSKLNRKHYFRHIIQDYEAQKRNLITAGKKLKEPTQRSWLRKRKNSEEYMYTTDYLSSEAEVLTQMFHDIEVAKIIKFMGDEYDIRPQILEKMVREAKPKEIAKFEEAMIGQGAPEGAPIWEALEDIFTVDMLEDIKPNWRESIKKGYVRWQPREGSIFHTVESFEGVMEKLGIEALKDKGLTKADIRRVLAKDPRFVEYIIPEELAETLNNLSVGKPSNPVAKLHKRAVAKWKMAQLQLPKRIVSYNIRNLTGDAEAMFIGNPSAFLKTPRAASEMGKYYYGKNKGKAGNISPELKQWIDRGGTMTTEQAQELGQLKSLNKFVEKQVRKMAPDKSIVDIPTNIIKNAWNKYWSETRRATDFRESIFRYAAYLDYLEQMKLGKGKEPGMPKNFGASKPQEIMGLKSIEDRAFWLSNELLGAYDRVGKAGQLTREHFIPFWSWKEVNMRRYKRFIQNAVNDRKLTKTVAKTTLGVGATVGIRGAMFVTKVLLLKAGLDAALNWYGGEAEEDLPKNIKQNTHVTLGKNKEGEIKYFSRIGTLDDALEWFGLEAPMEYWDDVMNKGVPIKQVMKKWAKQAAGNWANNFVNGAEPFVKIAGETITRRKLYPDVLNPSTIRNRIEHLLSPFPELQEAYNRLIVKKPQPHKFLSHKTLTDLFFKRVDEHSAAFSDVWSEKIKFKKRIGKATEGFMLSETGKALYNMKLALRYRDVHGFQFWAKEYVNRGGKEKNIQRSIDRMSPLDGLTKDEQKLFVGGMDSYTRNKFIKAMIFYEDMRTGKVFSYPKK